MGQPQTQPQGSEQEIVIEDEQPGAAPGLGLGDLWRWAPLIEKIITTVKAAITGGTTQIPALKIRVAGKRITLGPTPIQIDAG